VKVLFFTGRSFNFHSLLLCCLHKLPRIKKKERVAFKKNSKNNNNPHAESGGEYD
jgi:hypothetical protein